MITESFKLTKEFRVIPKEMWPWEDRWCLKVWVNNEYLVQLCRSADDHRRLSINRIDRTNDIRVGRQFKDGMTWDDLMEIKKGVGYENAWAIEIYPPKSRIINEANMRHLWLTEEPECAW